MAAKGDSGEAKFTPQDVDRLVVELPAYLSARATDMGGPRGLKALLRLHMKKGLSEEQAAELLPDKLRAKWLSQREADRRKQLGEGAATTPDSAKANKTPRPYHRLGSDADLARPPASMRRSRASGKRRAVPAAEDGQTGGGQLPGGLRDEPQHIRGGSCQQADGNSLTVGPVEGGLLQLQPVRAGLRLPLATAEELPGPGPLPPQATPVAVDEEMVSPLTSPLSEMDFTF